MYSDEITYIIILVLFLVFSFVFLKKIRNIRLRNFIGEYTVMLVYLLSLFVFILGFGLNSIDYKDVVLHSSTNGYSPFGISQIPTFITFLILFWISSIAIWLKSRKLPPLTLVLALCFLIIGIAISTVSILQLSHYSDPNTNCFASKMENIERTFLILYPAFNILLSLALVMKVIRERSKISFDKKFRNSFLNKLNNLMKKAYYKPSFILLLTIPVFLIITIILTIFGQEPDSIIKAFTHTTCWRFSEMSHPDYLPHQGHYLCTVAARGNPKIVKPLRIGKRHGKEIIVNRQLLISNAFEEMIQDLSPMLHRIIRKTYDNIGLPVAKWINNRAASNFTYIIMKPLECFFLICLYLFCNKPEQRINNQYKI